MNLYRVRFTVGVPPIYLMARDADTAVERATIWARQEFSMNDQLRDVSLYVGSVPTRNLLDPQNWTVILAL